jgi:hypothetical protein
MWRTGRAHNSIPIYSYIQQDATFHSSFISGNCSTCFGWYFHPSLGAHTTVSTASGICHTSAAIVEELEPVSRFTMQPAVSKIRASNSSVISKLSVVNLGLKNYPANVENRVSS